MNAFASSSSGSDISGRALKRIKKELEKFNEAKESNEAEGECLIYLLIFLPPTSDHPPYKRIQYQTHRFAH